MMKKIVQTPFPSDPLLTNAGVLGQAVRARRTQAGLTIEEAALSIGVAKQTISDLEHGKASVGIGLALRIAAQFGVHLLVAESADVAAHQRLAQERLL
jgi:transcriptional regulator with XRE-family HTH domain